MLRGVAVLYQKCGDKSCSLSPLPFLPSPLAWPAAALSCGHAGAGLARPWLGFAKEPPLPRRLQEGTVLRPRELQAARGLARVCAHQIQAVRNTDDGFNLLLLLQSTGIE